MVEIKRSKSRSSCSGFRLAIIAILSSILCVVSYLLYGFFDAVHHHHHYSVNSITSSSENGLRKERQHRQRMKPHPLMLDEELLSRGADVRIAASVRGNLGPPSVLNQPRNVNWLKDRWQAASDMHGTAIQGHHWVTLTFSTPIVKFTRIVLDWEAAYSKDYEIRGILMDKEQVMKSKTANDNDATAHNNNNNNNNTSSSVLLFTTKNVPEMRNNRHKDVPNDGRPGTKLIETRYGHSPGVKNPKIPLHVIHNITLGETEQPNEIFQGIRINIFSSAMGWGVSLWLVDVYGCKINDSNQREGHSEPFSA